MPVRSCRVSFSDTRGVTHSVEVHAETVLEAAALGVKTVRETGVLDDDEGALEITVEIQTLTRHTVPFSRVQAWLNGASRSPKERLLKERAR